jgi:hypothetical protein
VAKVKVRAKTFAGYQDMLRRYIRAELRARLLPTLGPMEIQAVTFYYSRRFSYMSGLDAPAERLRRKSCAEAKGVVLA